MTNTVTDDQGRKWRLGERPTDSKVESPFRGEAVGHVTLLGLSYVLMKRGTVYFIRCNNTNACHRVFQEKP